MFLRDEHVSSCYVKAQVDLWWIYEKMKERERGSVNIHRAAIGRERKIAMKKGQTYCQLITGKAPATATTGPSMYDHSGRSAVKFTGQVPELSDQRWW